MLVTQQTTKQTQIPTLTELLVSWKQDRNTSPWRKWLWAKDQLLSPVKTWTPYCLSRKETMSSLKDHAEARGPATGAPLPGLQKTRAPGSPPNHLRVQMSIQRAAEGHTLRSSGVYLKANGIVATVPVQIHVKIQDNSFSNMKSNKVEYNPFVITLKLWN